MRPKAAFVSLIVVSATITAPVAADPPSGARAEAVVQGSERDVRADFGGGWVAQVDVSFDARVFDDGNPSASPLFFPGKLKLSGTQTSRTAVATPILELRFDETRLVRADDGPIVTFAGTGVLCRSSGNCEELPLSGTVQQHASHDCLIYDLLGPDVHTTFESRGTFIVSS